MYLLGLGSVQSAHEGANLILVYLDSFAKPLFPHFRAIFAQGSTRCRSA